MEYIRNFLGKLKKSLPWTYPAEIRRLIPEGTKTILDVGCGDGCHMDWVNYPRRYKVTGIDISEEELEKARRHNLYEKLILLDLTKNRLPDDIFDVVICSQVIEHLPKSDAFALMKRLQGIARKRVIVATTNGFFEFDNHPPNSQYDKHLSGWAPKDFLKMGYRVQGHGVKLIYIPGGLKDILPRFLKPILFTISYLATPIVQRFHGVSLFLIAYKNIGVS